jgi:hypothetical protein
MENKELTDLVVSFGIVRYPLDKILNIIPDDVDKDEFTQQFNDPTHAIAKAYKKGIDRSDYDIDIRLFEMAKSGDLKALEKYEERQYDRQRKHIS